MNNPCILINFRAAYIHPKTFTCSLVLHKQVHKQVDLYLAPIMYNDTSFFLGRSYFLNSTKDLATILNKINLYENFISDIDADIRDITNAP